LSHVAFKIATAVTAFAAAVATVITVTYFRGDTTVPRVQCMPLTRRRALPLARQRCSVIAGVVVSAFIRSVAAVAARVFEVSELALPVLDGTKCLQ
jgi:hypothetical protein